MPIHDWTRKPAGLFHHFHQQWAGSIYNALNAGRLPEGFYALLEQQTAGVEPDILALEREPRASKSIWDEIREEPFELPSDKPLTMVAYSAGVLKKAYVDPVAVGDLLPDMPVFLDPATYILAPLEATYVATWETCLAPLRELISEQGR